MDSYIKKIRQYIEHLFNNLSIDKLKYIFIGKMINGKIYVPNTMDELIQDVINDVIKNKEFKEIVQDLLTQEEYKEFANYCREKNLTISILKQKIISENIAKKYINKYCTICKTANELFKYNLPRHKLYLDSTNLKLTNILKSLTTEDINKILLMSKEKLINWLFDNKIIHNFYAHDDIYLEDKILFILLPDSEYIKYVYTYSDNIFNHFKEYLKDFISIFSFLKLKRGESMKINGQMLANINHEASCKALVYINGNIITGENASITERTAHKNLIAKYNHNMDLHKDDIKNFTEEQWKEIINLPHLEYRSITHCTRCVINKDFIIIIDGGEFIDEVTNALSSKYSQPIFAFDDSLTYIVRTARLINKYSYIYKLIKIK